MSKTIQVRDVPDDVHHRLAVRAAERRQSLSEHVREHLVELTSRPTLDEMLARLAQRETIRVPETSGEAIRRERAGRSRSRPRQP